MEYFLRFCAEKGVSRHLSASKSTSALVRLLHESTSARLELFIWKTIFMSIILVRNKESFYLVFHFFFHFFPFHFCFRAQEPSPWRVWPWGQVHECPPNITTQLSQLAAAQASFPTLMSSDISVLIRVVAASGELSYRISTFSNSIINFSSYLSLMMYKYSF